MRCPTERQLEVLRFVTDYASTNGYPPSIREISGGIGVASLRGTTVHLDALERKGLLRRVVGVARGIVLTDEGRQAIR